ncbi:MAG: hypothetical protein A2539_01870 [Elusimicrobia bacterium RIFOXYD2_FULL_34_15]|nr:MAG: hypothetical protein A2539_01870 [Elusimicrobia bacterium RIFOXYD2_FULL_34_15]
MTKYEHIQVQSILNRLNDKLDGFSSVYSLNPYRGCEHACQYCYVLSDKYIPYKKKEEFFYKIQLKANASFLLQEALSKIPIDCLIIVGTSCDPYQPAEKEYKNTRSILEVLYDFKNPVHIITKSDLILRDIDLLEKISSKTFLAVSFSISMNDALSSFFEPRATKPSKRFKALSILSDHNIRCGVFISPILPYIVDDKIVKNIISTASISGAKYISVDELRLRDTNKTRFLDFIKTIYPKLVNRYEVMFSKNSSPPEIFSKNIVDYAEKMAKELNLETSFSENFHMVKKQMELF